MAVLGKDWVLKLIEKHKVVNPFDFNLLDGDSYVLTVRDEIVLNYLEHQNLVSNEIVFMPPNCVGLLTAKSRYGRLGLSFLNAAKIHNGWIGRVVLEVANLSNDRKPILIKKGDPFMHLMFMQREGEPSVYNGEYNFQLMSDEEVKFYKEIMLRDFPHVFNAEVLERQIKNRII